MCQQRQALFAFVYDKRGRLLSVGQNSYTRTHTLMFKAGSKMGKPNSIYLHAEVAALVKIKDWTKPFRMVVTRHTKDGQPAMAKPCNICMSVIKQTSIKEIEWTT